MSGLLIFSSDIIIEKSGFSIKVFFDWMLNGKIYLVGQVELKGVNDLEK